MGSATSFVLKGSGIQYRTSCGGCHLLLTRTEWQSCIQACTAGYQSQVGLPTWQCISSQSDVVCFTGESNPGADAQLPDLCPNQEIGWLSGMGSQISVTWPGFKSSLGHKSGTLP